jgi:hypothetical protein
VIIVARLKLYGIFLIKCAGHGVDRNIKDAGEKLLLEISMRSESNDERLFDVTLAYTNRKIITISY